MANDVVPFEVMDGPLNAYDTPESAGRELTQLSATHIMDLADPEQSAALISRARALRNVVRLHNEAWEHQIKRLEPYYMACFAVMGCVLLAIILCGTQLLGYGLKYTYLPEDLAAERNATLAWCFSAPCTTERGCVAFHALMENDDTLDLSTKCGGRACASPFCLLPEWTTCHRQCVDRWTHLQYVEQHTASDGPQRRREGVIVMIVVCTMFLLSGLALVGLWVRRDLYERRMIRVNNRHLMLLLDVKEQLEFDRLARQNQNTE